MSCINCPYLEKNYAQIPNREFTKIKLAIVAEAPMAKEIRSDNYWGSRGVDVIIGIMKKLGIKSEDVEIFHIFNCGVRKKSGEKFSNVAIKQCRTRLIKDLQAAQPDVIVTLGTDSLHSVTNDFSLKIKQQIGSTLKIAALPNTKIVPLLHPAILLRSPGEYKVFYQMFLKVKDYLDGDEIQDPGETEWEAVRTRDDVRDVIDFLEERDQKLVACDIESTGLKSYETIKDTKSDVLMFGLAYEKNKAFAFAKSSLRYCQELFNIKTKFLWHNGQFDKLMMAVCEGLDIRIDEDLILAHYTLNETTGTHGLEQLSVQVIGADPYKSEANAYIKSAAGFGSAPEKIILKRGCVDSDYTLQIFEPLIKEILKDEGFTRVYYDFLIPGTNAYTKIEMNGLRANRKALKEFEEILECDIAEVLDDVNEIMEGVWDRELYMLQTGAKSAPVEFNPGSWQQKSWLIYDRLKLKPRIRKKKSTEADIIKSIPNPPTIIKLILKYQSLKKELSTYVKGFLIRMDHEDRVHTNFKLFGTATGRRSSVGPNIQNLPARKGRDFRRVIVPREGYVLVEIDYSGAELRALAMYSGDKQLRYDLEHSSPHDEMSLTLYGEGFTKIQRIRAKAAIFGWAYGRGDRSLAEELNMPLAEASAIFNGLAARYPDASKYLDQCAQDVIEGKTIRTIIGRAKRPGLITKQTLAAIQNEYKNYRMQSTISDFILATIIEIDRRDLISCPEVYVINECHDSILFEMLDDDEVIERISGIICDIMEEQPVKWANWDLPFVSDVEVGYNWEDIVDLADFRKARPYLAKGMTAKQVKKEVLKCA